MPHSEVVLTETCDSKNILLNYIKQNYSIVIKKRQNKHFTQSIIQRIIAFFCEILLPYGYPDCVSSDYFNYQFWDTIQAINSTVIGIFTTQAILKSFGVGNAEATALSATITWVVKDGAGMLGKILFTWFVGKNLDSNCKKWRLFADFLNDGAMLLELILPHFQSYLSIYLLSISTIFKAIVGVAGGATRASITQHQAIKGNMAEVSAKDASQETVVNLFSSIVGILLINWLEHYKNYSLQWIMIGLLIFIHLYANYRAVTSLVFKNFNNLRIILVIKDYIVINAVPTPKKTNKNEPVIMGTGLNIQNLCGFQIKMGVSLKQITKFYDYFELKNILQLHHDKRYLVIPDVRYRIIYVTFEKGETGRDVIAAYFSAVLLGMALCMYNNISIDNYTKRKLHHSNPITRLNSFMRNFHNTLNKPINIPIRIQNTFDGFLEQEVKMFFIALEIAGWTTDNHSLDVGSWRAEWKDNKKFD